MSTRAAVDVTGLPSTTFGHRDLAWWATAGFIAIEGVTLAITVVVYFYLRRNFPQWPPPRTARPDLLLGGVQAALMIASWIPIRLLDLAARRLDLGAVRTWLVVGGLLAVVFVILRALELEGVHTRWDSHAYGSAVWCVLVAHGTLLLAEAIEIVVLAALFFTPRVTERHFSDTSDAAFYWYFMTGAWLPLAAMLYLVPLGAPTR